MLKGLRVLALSVIIAGLFMVIRLSLEKPIDVSAGVTSTVSVTFTPTGGVPIGSPTGFTATRINDYKVRLNWGNFAGAGSTHIRGKVGGYPTSITDGYLVYNGLVPPELDDVDLTSGETRYYSAFTVIGALVSAPAHARTGGSSMFMMVLAVIAVVITIGAYAMKNGVLKWIAAGGWLILGGYAYTQSSTAWDINYALFWLCMGAMMAVALEYTWGEYQDKKQRRVNVNVELEQFKSDYQGQQEVYDSLRMSNPSIARRSRPYSTNDEEKMLAKKASANSDAWKRKLEEKYGKGKEVKRKR